MYFRIKTYIYRLKSIYLQIKNIYKRQGFILCIIFTVFLVRLKNTICEYMFLIHCKILIISTL